MKTCHECKRTKELEAFAKYKMSKDGHKGICIECYLGAHRSRESGKSWFTARDWKATID